MLQKCDSIIDAAHTKSSYPQFLAEGGSHTTQGTQDQPQERIHAILAPYAPEHRTIHIKNTHSTHNVTLKRVHYGTHSTCTQYVHIRTVEHTVHIQKDTIVHAATDRKLSQCARDTHNASNRRNKTLYGTKGIPYTYACSTVPRYVL